jgi:long-chain acyl-CoA synthetase
MNSDMTNLVRLFFEQAKAKGDKPFLSAKQNNAWVSRSWNEVARDVAALAQALKELGLAKGDRVMLVSENRPEWCIADLGIMAAGCITVPTYTTNTAADHAHIIADSGARAIIVSTPKIAANLLPAILRSGSAKHVIGMEPLKVGQSGEVHYHDWDALLRAQKPDVEQVTTQADFARDAVACLIYTSGTSGSPRGVQQTHGAILTNIVGASAIVLEDFPHTPDVFLSFLPLSHAYEHTAGQFIPIYLGAHIYYAEGLEKLAANMEEVRPTIMVIVPRLLELLRARVLKAIEKQGPTAQGLMRRALALGQKRQAGKLRLWDRPVDLLLDATIRKKLQGRFGGRIKALVCGGAPLNPEVGNFFENLGLTVLQGYGQTEAAPLISCNRPRVGIATETVGAPLLGVELKIADDGEILVRGEMVMPGYWNRPEDSAAALEGGWLHTGDIGHLDAKGRLMITDRKKDIIVNDKGENIAPQKIEGMLTLTEEIHQAMVSGDKRPHLVGLIVPDPEWALEWARANDEKYDLAALCKLPAFYRAVMAAVDRVNTALSVTEKVRRIILIPDAFTIENEMLTPSIKIRRHKIKSVYGEQLDALYR